MNLYLELVFAFYQTEYKELYMVIPSACLTMHAPIISSDQMIVSIFVVELIDQRACDAVYKYTK